MEALGMEAPEEISRQLDRHLARIEQRNQFPAVLHALVADTCLSTSALACLTTTAGMHSCMPATSRCHCPTTLRLDVLPNNRNVIVSNSTRADESNTNICTT